MKNWIKKITALVLAAAMLLTGCSAKNDEEQDALKATAIAALKEGNYEEATAGFDEALSYAGGKVSAREIDICYYKALSQYLSGDVASSCETLNNVIAYDEKNADAFFLRGSIYLSEGENEKAVDDYRSCIKYDEGNCERVVQIFSALNGADRREDALSIVSSALSSIGETDEDMIWRGRMYILLEQYDNAYDALKKASDASLGKADIYLAQVLYEQGDTDGAEQKLLSYVASESATAEGMASAGEIYMEMEQYEAAYECFTKGIAFYTPSEDEKPAQSLSQETYRRLLSDRVGACEFLSDWDDALKYAREYIADYPQDEHMLEEIKFLATR